MLSLLTLVLILSTALRTISVTGLAHQGHPHTSAIINERTPSEPDSPKDCNKCQEQYASCKKTATWKFDCDESFCLSENATCPGCSPPCGSPDPGTRIHQRREEAPPPAEPAPSDASSASPLPIPECVSCEARLISCVRQVGTKDNRTACQEIHCAEGMTCIGCPQCDELKRRSIPGPRVANEHSPVRRAAMTCQQCEEELGGCPIYSAGQSRFLKTREQCRWDQCRKPGCKGCPKLKCDDPVIKNPERPAGDESSTPRLYSRQAQRQNAENDGHDSVDSIHSIAVARDLHSAIDPASIAVSTEPHIARDQVPLRNYASSCVVCFQDVVNCYWLKVPLNWGSTNETSNECMKKQCERQDCNTCTSLCSTILKGEFQTPPPPPPSTTPVETAATGSVTSPAAAAPVSGTSVDTAAVPSVSGAPNSMDTVTLPSAAGAPGSMETIASTGAPVAGTAVDTAALSSAPVVARSMEIVIVPLSRRLKATPPHCQVGCPGKINSCNKPDLDPEAKASCLIPLCDQESCSSCPQCVKFHETAAALATRGKASVRAMETPTIAREKRMSKECGDCAWDLRNCQDRECERERCADLNHCKGCERCKEFQRRNSPGELEHGTPL